MKSNCSGKVTSVAGSFSQTVKYFNSVVIFSNEVPRVEFVFEDLSVTCHMLHANLPVLQPPACVRAVPIGMRHISRTGRLVSIAFGGSVDSKVLLSAFLFRERSNHQVHAIAPSCLDALLG